MKKLFSKIGQWFSVLFGSARKFEKFLIENVDDAIEIVKKINSFTDSAVVKTILFFLPGKYKDVAENVLEKVSSVIDRVIEELGMAEVCLSKGTTLERLKCFAEHLKKLSPPMQEAVSMKFASLYTQTKLKDEGRVILKSEAPPKGSAKSKPTFKSQRQIFQASTIDTIVQNRYVALKEKL